MKGFGKIFRLAQDDRGQSSIKKVKTQLAPDGYWYVPVVEQKFPHIQMRIAGMQQGDHNFWVGDDTAKQNVCKMAGVPSLSDLVLSDEKGSDIAVVDESWGGRRLEKVNTFITSDVGMPLVMRSGDAPFLFFWDTMRAGIAHLTNGDVGSSSPSKIAEAFGTADSHWLLGPGIQKCHYRKDLFKDILEQLASIGVDEDRIWMIDECMYHSGKYFSKTRREDEGDTKLQGNAAVIRLRSHVLPSSRP